MTLSEVEDTESTTYKIILIGDSSVGKTCLFKKLTTGNYSEKNISTIGMDRKSISVNIKIIENGSEVEKSFNIQLWDTAGQERFRTIAKSYYKGAHGIILMYDVSNKKSFDNIRKWINQINEQASKQICVILIANKIDTDERVVTKEDGEALAQKFELKFFESSAMGKINVDEAFDQIIKDISEVYESSKNEGIQITAKDKKEGKKKCC